MSFGQFNKQKLLDIAAYFQVDVDESQTKPEIEASIKLAGVSWAAYKKFEAEQESETEKSEASFFTDSRVLLKMERQNPVFEAYGYTFTKDNPFVLMNSNAAQDIIDAYEGFRIATPAEAKSFYN